MSLDYVNLVSCLFWNKPTFPHWGKDSAFESVSVKIFPSKCFPVAVIISRDLPLQIGTMSVSPNYTFYGEACN